MTVFNELGVLQEKSAAVQVTMTDDVEDYEKIPLSPVNGPAQELTKPLDHLQGRTLMRLTLGCGSISLLLLFIGSVGNLPVLITEGIHSSTDTLCYLVAWIIDVKSRQNFGNEKRLPYGIRRLTVLGGFFIGCFTATSIVFIILENVRQVILTPDPNISANSYSKWAIFIGFLELFFNALVLILHSTGGHGHSHSHGPCSRAKDDANTEGALMHAITDLSTASIVLISSIMQLVVSERAFVFVNIAGCIIIFSAMGGVAITLIKDNGRILMQSTPINFPLDAFISAISEVNGVASVNTVRVWQVDVPENLTASLIVAINADVDHKAVLQTIREICRNYNIIDAVIESR